MFNFSASAAQVHWTISGSPSKESGSSSWDPRSALSRTEKREKALLLARRSSEKGLPSPKGVGQWHFSDCEVPVSWSLEGPGIRDSGTLQALDFCKSHMRKPRLQVMKVSGPGGLS